MIDGYSGLSAYGDYGTYGASALERWVRSRRKKAKTRREKAKDIVKQMRRAKKAATQLPAISAASRRAPIVRARARRIARNVRGRVAPILGRRSGLRAAAIAAPALLIPGIGPMVSAGVLGLAALRKRATKRAFEGGYKKGMSAAQKREMALRATIARKHFEALRAAGPGAMVPSADYPSFSTEGGVSPLTMPAAVEPEAAMTDEALAMEAPSIPWLPILLGVAVLGGAAFFLRGRKGRKRSSSPAPTTAPSGAKKKRKKRRAA